MRRLPTRVLDALRARTGSPGGGAVGGLPWAVPLGICAMVVFAGVAFAAVGQMGETDPSPAAAPGGQVGVPSPAEAQSGPVEVGVPSPPGRPGGGASGVLPHGFLGHRRPVLLVPGWGDGREVLLPLRERFLAAGWSADSVWTVEFDDPVGSNRVHAEELAEAVDRLRERTGAVAVDVVAHSMGGLAVRRYLLDGGAESVRRVVFLATPHRGTASAHLAWGEGAREMEPGSRFLLELVRGRGVPRGVRAITVRTPLDLHVIPVESATLPGMPNVEVCCPTHNGLLDDDPTFEAVQRFLEAR